MTSKNRYEIRGLLRFLNPDYFLLGYSQIVFSVLSFFDPDWTECRSGKLAGQQSRPMRRGFPAFLVLGETETRDRCAPALAFVF
jgi:hypothetical protein